MDAAFGNFQIRVATNVDLTKPMTLSNNVVAPILIPFIAGFFGTIGSFFTWLLFEGRLIVLPLLVIAEAFAAAMTVSRRWGGDMLVKCTMALLAWIMLKWIQAILLVIILGLLSSPDASPVMAAMCALIALPVILWMFIKVMASHRVSLVGGAITASTLWRSIPGTPSVTAA
jgi:hypothetical protein